MPAPIFDEPTTLPARPRMTARQVRDLVSVLLVVVGAVGLIVCAWAWHPLAGAAVLSLAVVAAGVVLGLDW